MESLSERVPSFHKWNPHLLPLSNPFCGWEAASPRGPALLIQASLLPSSTVPTQRKLHPQCFTSNMSLLSVRKHLPRGVLSDPAVELRPTCPAYLPTHNQLASKHHSAPAQEPSPNFGSMKRNSPRTNTCIGLRHRRHPNFRERHSLFCSNLQGYARGCSWLLRCSDCSGTWHMAHGRKLPRQQAS